MTRAQKIESVLNWALHAAPIGTANAAYLRQQFELMTDDEIERRYLQQQRRRKING
jgi:hypothetical protein